MPRVTLKMLSERTGLAVSTISEILNAKPNYCSPETRKYVLDTASELGYTPNLGFRLMTGRDTATAAILYSQRRVLFDEHNQTLALLLLESLEKQKRSAYTVVLSISPQENIARIRELISRGCREFFFLGAPMGDREIYDLLKKEKLKRANFNSFNADGKSILIDFRYICERFVDCFQAENISPCCLFTQTHFDRYAKEVFISRGLDPESHFIEVEDHGHIQQDCFQLSYDRTFRAIDSYVKRASASRTGWICMSDCDAMGALAALRKNDLPIFHNGIPLVCGFGNSSYSRLSVLPVNSVDLKLKDVANFMLSSENTPRTYLPDIIIKKGF